MRIPADPTPAFVPLHGVELDGILCEQDARTVGQDNVVTFEEIPLQLAKQPGRRTCAAFASPCGGMSMGCSRSGTARAVSAATTAAGDPSHSTS